MYRSGGVCENLLVEEKQGSGDDRQVQILASGAGRHNSFAPIESSTFHSETATSSLAIGA